MAASLIETLDLYGLCSALEVVGAEVFVLDHVIGGCKHGRRDCANRLLGTVSDALTTELLADNCPSYARLPRHIEGCGLQPGAALAITERIRMFECLRRWPNCGSPCKRCANEYPAQAIHPEGHINVNECISCMHC